LDRVVKARDDLVSSLLDMRQPQRTFIARTGAGELPDLYMPVHEI